MEIEYRKKTIIVFIKRTHSKQSTQWIKTISNEVREAEWFALRDLFSYFTIIQSGGSDFSSCLLQHGRIAWREKLQVLPKES